MTPPNRKFEILFKFFQNSLKILNVYFWGDNVYLEGSGVYFGGNKAYSTGFLKILGFWELLFVAGGVLGHLGSACRGFEKR